MKKTNLKTIEDVLRYAEVNPISFDDVVDLLNTASTELKEKILLFGHQYPDCRDKDELTIWMRSHVSMDFTAQLTQPITL